jgi:phosphoketolase
VPGLNLLHVHANRLIKAQDLDVAYVGRRASTPKVINP